MNKPLGCWHNADSCLMCSIKSVFRHFHETCSTSVSRDHSPHDDGQLDLPALRHALGSYMSCTKTGCWAKGAGAALQGGDLSSPGTASTRSEVAWNGSVCLPHRGGPQERTRKQRLIARDRGAVLRPLGNATRRPAARSRPPPRLEAYPRQG